jgi:hypothetical protein
MNHSTSTNPHQLRLACTHMRARATVHAFCRRAAGRWSVQTIKRRCPTVAFFVVMDAQQAEPELDGGFCTAESSSLCAARAYVVRTCRSMHAKQTKKATVYNCCAWFRAYSSGLFRAPICSGHRWWFGSPQRALNMATSRLPLVLWALVMCTVFATDFFLDLCHCHTRRCGK